MSQTVVTVDVGGTGANNANAALTNLGALPTFGGSISGNLNVASSLVVTGNANLGNYVVSGNSISTTQTNGDVVLTPKGTGRLRVRSKILSGNGAEAHFDSAGIDESSIGIGSFHDSNGAAELLIVNKNSGTLAYSEMIAINDTGDQDQGWISVGVNSSGYDDPEYTLTGPDDGYVLFEAPQGTTANGDLIIGTGSYGLNNKIVMAAGGFTPTDAQLVIMPADLKRANLTSYIVASNVVTFTTDTTHTFIANDIVAISSVGAPYDGTRTITAVTSNTFNVSVTASNIGPINLSPAGFALQFLPFNKGTVELTAQLFVGENSRSTIETADITLAQGHAIPLGIVVDNDGPGQTVMFNKSNGALSYSEYIAHNDAGNVEHGWISVGINSSGYDDPEFPITKADDGYLLFEPPEGTTENGDLIIGTGTFGQKNRLIFAAEGFDEANAQMIITPNESVRISIDTDASSANTGALQIVGGVGVQGSMYVQGNQTIQGDLIVNGSQVIQSIENLAAAGPISLLSDGNIANTWDQGIVGTYAISKTSNTQSVTFKAIANNTGTLTTANNHGFVAEDYVTVANVDVTFNGTHRITAATSNTISFFLLANNLSITAATGTATVDKAARYTGLVKRASDGNWRFFSGLGTRPAFNTDFTDANLAFDSIIAGSADFRGSLKLGSPNTATIVYTDNNARTLTIPALAGNRTFAFINEAQTFTAAQAVSSTVTATKFIPTAGDATGNGLYLSGANKLGLTADGVERVSIGASETVINDGSNDYDFRVESDDNANMLFVDGGNSRVGIGTGSPTQKLSINGRFHSDTNNNYYGAWGEGNTATNGYSFFAVGEWYSASLYIQKKEGQSFAHLYTYSNTHHIALQAGSLDNGTTAGGGNVGIGTTNPSQKLTVSGNLLVSSANPDTGGIYFQATTGTNAVAMTYNNSGGNAFVGLENSVGSRISGVAYALSVWHESARAIALGTNNTLRAIIDASGNVGIGTTSPGAKLDVFGGIRSTTSSTTGTAQIEALNDLGTMVLQTGLFGSTKSGTTFGLNNANLAFMYTTTYSSGHPSALAIGTTSSQPLVFGTSATERMRIDGSGSVGIGTTNPSKKIHVEAATTANSTFNSNDNVIGIFKSSTITANAWGSIKLQADEGSGFWFSDENGTNNHGYISCRYTGVMDFATGDDTSSAPTIKVRIAQTGNVGIGTTSVDRKLHVHGGSSNVQVRIDTNSPGDPLLTWTTLGQQDWSAGIDYSDSGKFKIQNSLSAGTDTRLTIDSSGNVGIGTQNPEVILHLHKGSAGANTNFIRIDMPSWGSSVGYFKNIVWGDPVVVGGIGMEFNNSTTNMHFHSFYNGGYTSSVLMSIIGNGDVGIGTSTPSARFDVRGSSDYIASFRRTDWQGGGVAKIAIGKSYAVTGFISSDVVEYVNDTSYIALNYKNGLSSYAEGLRVHNNGNIGIGTTSPAAKIDIYPGASDLGAGANGIRVQRPGSYGQYGYLEYLVSSDITVLGSLYTGGGAGSFGVIRFRQHSSTTSRDSMTINNVGNVGINTTNPTSSLDVYGQISINSNRALARINSIDTGYNYQIVGSASGSNGGGLGSFDLRTPNPQNFSTGMMSFGFTSYTLDNNPNWADYIFMNSYTDGTGGDPNIFLINRNTSGVKVARQTYNSATAFNAGTIYTLDYTSASDQSVKEDVQNITGALDKIMQLRPVTFKWTDEYILNGMSRNANENISDPETGAIVIPEEKTINVGLIAQEVEVVIPTVVHQENVKLKGAEDYLKNVNYDKLVPHLIAALQELKTEFDAYKQTHP